MRAALLAALALALAGCLQTQAPARVDPSFTPPPDGWDHQVSVRLGPRMLQVGLPLLLAHQSPELPLYFRHLNRVSVSVYTAPAGAPPTPVTRGATLDSWETVLRLRDETSTITLLHDAAAPSLDRFYLLMDDDTDRIVAYAEGDLWAVVRQALRSEL